MSAASILLVSTDAEVREAYQRLADQIDVELDVAASLREAGRNMVRRSFDALFVQMDDPSDHVRTHLGNGLRFTTRPPTFGTSHNASIRDAVDALRAGAREYVGAPPNGASGLRQIIRRARRASGGLEGPGGTPAGDAAVPMNGLVTTDRRLLAACETLLRVARTDVPVIIAGENGTGRSYLARMVHQHSHRGLAPFVEFQCAGPPEALVETELFGRMADRASRRRCQPSGRFELADGGTLALEGLDRLSPELQTRILQAARTGRFERRGDSRPCTANVRLVVALTLLRSRPVDPHLEGPLAERTAVRVSIPPLRERVGDIPILARHFLGEFCEKHGRAVEDFAAEALSALARYDWPGNVTELRNAVEHGVVLARGRRIEPGCLPPAVAEPEGRRGGADADGRLMPLKAALREPERRYILRTLEELDWNKKHTARRLGISRSTLYKKLKEHGLDDGRATRTT